MKADNMKPHNNIKVYQQYKKQTPSEYSAKEGQAPLIRPSDLHYKRSSL